VTTRITLNESGGVKKHETGPALAAVGGIREDETVKRGNGKFGKKNGGKRRGRNLKTRERPLPNGRKRPPRD